MYALDTLRELLPIDVNEAAARLVVLTAPELMAASRDVQRDWRTAIERLKANADAPLPADGESE